MSERLREPVVDFSIEEKGQLPSNSNDDDIIENDNKNVEAASTSIPQLTLEKSISIKYRTL